MNTVKVGFGVSAEGPDGGVPRSYVFNLRGVPRQGDFIRHAQELWQVLRVEWDIALQYPICFCVLK